MTKPWEESWDVNEMWPAEIRPGVRGPIALTRMGGSYAGGNFTHVDLNWVIAGFGVADDAGESLARARLAACAPEMARLLLSIEWDGVLGCPVCSSYPPLTGTAGHKQGCALAAVLRKAGVKE